MKLSSKQWENRLIDRKFGTVYLVIGTQSTVYIIDHLTKVFFMEKMLGGTLTPMAHLPQIPLCETNALWQLCIFVNLLLDTFWLFWKKYYIFSQKPRLTRQENEMATKQNLYKFQAVPNLCRVHHLLCWSCKNIVIINVVLSCQILLLLILDK